MPDRPLLKPIHPNLDEPTHEALTALCRRENLDISALYEALSRLLLDGAARDRRPPWVTEAMRSAHGVRGERKRRA